MVASPELCAGLDGRAAPDLAASRAADLPVDTMYEIFLRLPAKLLCRLRAVCRTWRSFLSDPEFAAAHAAAARRRLEPPLIIAGYNDRSFEISLANIMDLSGGIVKQAPGWPQCRGHARPQPRLRHEHHRRQLQICRPSHCSCVLRMGRGRTHPARHCGQVSGRAGCEHGGVQGATEGYAFSCRRIWVPV
jgi:hypothetical protein